MIKKKLTLKKAIGNESRIKENRFFYDFKTNLLLRRNRKKKSGKLNDKLLFYESNSNVTIYKHSFNNLFSIEILKTYLKRKCG